MRRIFAVVAAVALWAPGAAARAADFYEGKSIRIVTGGNAGGGYDAHTRLIGFLYRAAHSGKSLLHRAEHAGRIGHRGGELYLQRRQKGRNRPRTISTATR